MINYVKNALDKVLKQGNTQEIANTLWSYARLGYRNDDLFINSESKLKYIMDEGNRIELSKLCDIYLVLQLDKEEF